MNDAPVPPPAHAAAQAAFEAMAERIGRNGADFGGAFVIAAPDGDGGVRVEHSMTLDGAQRPAVFWANLQTVCRIALDEIERSSRRGGF
jgi:hypothetical protein